MTTEILHVPEQQRYELRIDGELAGLADYRTTGDEVHFTHTETLAGFRGQGVARKLVEFALADVRAAGRSAMPHCWYVAQLIGEAPEEWLALVPPARRREFGLPD